MRVALAGASIVLAAFVLTAAGAGGAARDLGAAVSASRPRTIAVLPTRVHGLAADGRRLAWAGCPTR